MPGEPLSALGRMVNALFLARAHASSKKLSVESVAGVTGRMQFAGDGTPGHPPLYDRDVLAALPFALGDHAWVVPVYVMSRDVRRELEPESFRVTLAGLAGRSTRASLYDPLSGTFEPVAISARRARGVTVDLRATDAPRLLFLSDGVA
jgi:hypothetical protein